MKPEGQPSAEVPPSGGDPTRAGAGSPDRVVAAAADAQQTAKPHPAEPATEQRPGAPSPAAAAATPERVDWTAILEERALVPDSEAQSPIAEAVVVPGEPGRRRGLLYLVVALTALFSLVASAAVVVALMRDDKAAATTAPDRERDDEAVARPPPQEPPPAPPTEPAGGAAAAAGASDPASDRAAAAADEEKARAEAEKRTKSEREAQSDKGEKPRKTEKDRTAKDEKRANDAGGKDGEAKDREVKRAGKDGEPKDDEAKDGEPKGGSQAKGDSEAGAAAPVGDRPDKPSVKDLAKAIEPLEPKIHACAKENGVTGSVAIKLEVEADGKIAWAAVREGGGAFQACVNKVVRAIKLPASQSGGTLIHSVALPDP